MNAIIDAAMARSRTVVTSFIVILLFGVITYINIPKEADPDIPIPWVMVQVFHEGISPEDGERLILKPLEQELRAVEGLKEMKSVAAENIAYVMLEFDVSFDADSALQEVRDKVDLARPELPADSEEPLIQEFNASLFPVIGVALSGDLPERTLRHAAEIVSEKIKQIPEVLSADIVGDREELLEVLVDPAKLESYNVSLQELTQAASLNNRLIAAGAMQDDESRFSIKVPGLFETRQDVMRLPIKASGDGVVTLGDIAEIRRTFKDVQTTAHVNGKPAIAVWAVKRLGENAVLTTQKVREAVASVEPILPPGIRINYTNDVSRFVNETQQELQAAVLTAIVLVMIIVVAALGLRTGVLVGLAIPSSFMFGFMLLGILDVTVNMMVMFGLVLSVGLLVDGAIVVVELADRKMAEGMHRKQAYAIAAKRMAWPIISSTLTTLAAFLPLLFWPGVSGRFMSFLPLTLIIILTASLFVALIFLPVFGSMVGKAGTMANPKNLKALAVSEEGDVTTMNGITGIYARFLSRTIKHPFIVIGVVVTVLVSVVNWYGSSARGTEFFMDSDPEEAVIVISARGNLSPYRSLELVSDVENIVLAEPGVKVAFAEVGVALGNRGLDLVNDAVGTINVEFTDWQTRRPSRQILASIREKTDQLSGINVQILERRQGPLPDKEIDIQFSAMDQVALEQAVTIVRNMIDNEVDGLVDVEDSRPLPGIDWQLKIDREQAARFGVDVTTVGGVVQLVTNGIMIGDYRPDDALEEIDIRARFPETYRTLEGLDRLRVTSRQGPVPITNFVTREAAPRVSQISRIDSERVMHIKANPAEGFLADDVVKVIGEKMQSLELPPGVEVEFRGSNEEQKEAADFLGKALLVSLFLMGITLITQFNSFYHTVLILSSIILSTVGVMLGIILRDQTFSVILTGTGIIALAGIVVNNNIVLVDTYQYLRKEGQDPIEAIVRTGAQRLRPVLLTTITTMCGILPMAYQINVDFIAREITYGAPQGMWWVQLATAIVFGLGFATMLTLIVTPTMIVMPYQVRNSWLGKKLFRRSADKDQTEQPQTQPAE